MKEEIEEKLERLIRLINEEGLGGILINLQPNFAWLTAGGRNGIDSSREAGVGTLLIRRDGRKFILANRIEMPRIVSEELVGQDYEPVEFGWEEERSSPSFVADLARTITNEGLPLGSDASCGNATCVLESAISRARYRLTDHEIDRFRSLGRDAGDAIGSLARALPPGISEREVARRAIDALGDIGATSSVMLVAADERIKQFRHPVPTDLVWRKSLMIVVCARRAGLIASLTRLVCVGEIPDDLVRRTEAAAGVSAKMFAATKPGASGSDVFEVASRAYCEAGFSGEEHFHHQGGAAGYRTRDWIAHPLCGETIHARQAFAWNPSITGTKIEETSIALETGLEVITTTADWPSIRAHANGCEYLLPGILTL